MTPTSPERDPGTPDPAPGPAPAGLIWTRPPKEKRERPARDAVVAAATDLADTHGLDAVSIRRVAAALSPRPMDLSRDFARKDECIDLRAAQAVAAAVLGSPIRPAGEEPSYPARNRAASATGGVP